MALLPKNPRDQKMVAVAVVAFALAALSWNFVWTPRHAQLTELAVQVSRQERWSLGNGSHRQGGTRVLRSCRQDSWVTPSAPVAFSRHFRMF